MPYNKIEIHKGNLIKRKEFVKKDYPKDYKLIESFLKKKVLEDNISDKRQEKILSCFRSFLKFVNKDFDNVYLFMDKSENVFPKLIKRELEFDLIFIDGDHSYSACKNDLENSFKLLSVGGFVVLDDAFRPPVIQAIREFEVLGHKCFCNPHGDCITFSDWKGVGIPMFRREK